MFPAKLRGAPRSWIEFDETTNITRQGLGQFGDGGPPPNYWWSQMFSTKKVWFLNTVELPCNGTSRDRRKSVADGELTLTAELQ